MLVVFAARKPSMAFVPSRDGLEHRPETMWDEEGGGGGRDGPGNRNPSDQSEGPVAAFRNP